MPQFYFLTIYFICVYLFLPFKFFYNLYGINFYKKNQPILPESLGLEIGLTFLLSCLFSNIPTLFLKEYSQILTYLFIIWILAVIDDVIEFKFSNKALVFGIANFIFYLLINPLRSINFDSLRINYFHIKSNILINFLKMFFFIAVLGTFIFSTHSINLLGGINGIEIIQAISILSFLQILIIKNKINKDYRIILFLLNETLINISLLAFFSNKFPASYFVGDSYTLLAGSLIGLNLVFCKLEIFSVFVIGIQFFNFIYGSLEIFQLFGFKRDKRRMPKFNSEENSLVMGQSRTVLNLILWVFGSKKENELLDIFCWLQGGYLIFLLILTI